VASRKMMIGNRVILIPNPNQGTQSKLSSIQ
jgi:hypothetical protein